MSLGDRLGSSPVRGGCGSGGAEIGVAQEGFGRGTDLGLIARLANR